MSVIYPAYLTGRTIDESLKVSHRVKGSTINLGSFSVPVTLLGLVDKPRIPPAISDEQSMQILSLTLHKLAAYWTVQGCVSVVETVLYVPSVLPFYSVIRFGLSLWLVFPLVSGTTVSKTWDIEDEWKQFCRSGAGMVFTRFLLPLVSHDPLNGESPVDIIMQYLRKALSLVESPDNQQWFKRVVGSYAASSAEPEAKEVPKTDDDDDYDVVDKPLPAEVDGVTQRKPEKKGWLW